MKFCSKSIMSSMQMAHSKIEVDNNCEIMPHEMFDQYSPMDGGAINLCEKRTFINCHSCTLF